MSAISPHSKRLRSRSSSSRIWCGGQSLLSDDLFLRVVQRVERVEELRLRPLLADDELDVVDEQDIDAAVPFAELEDAVVPDGVDDLVHEPLGRDVGELECWALA